MSSTTETLNVGDALASTIASSPGLVRLFTPERGIAAAILLSTKEPLLIGREAPAGLVLPFGSVSREHARVVFRNDEWQVEDLESRSSCWSSSWSGAKEGSSASTSARKC